MNTDAFECPTCGSVRRFRDDLTGRLPDCCHDALHRLGANVQTLALQDRMHRDRDFSRRVFDAAADRLVTHPDPKVRQEAQKYRQARHAPPGKEDEGT